MNHQGESSVGRAKRRSQIPDDFAVTHEMRQWVTSQGFILDPLAETERFVDHYRSKGTTFVDPVRAWRNWMRKAEEFRQQQRPATRSNRGRSSSAIDSVRAQVDGIAASAIEGGS